MLAAMRSRQEEQQQLLMQAHQAQRAHSDARIPSSGLQARSPLQQQQEQQEQQHQQQLQQQQAATRYGYGGAGFASGYALTAAPMPPAPPGTYAPGMTPTGLRLSDLVPGSGPGQGQRE